jgi:hypothetical protein
MALPFVRIERLARDNVAAIASSFASISYSLMRSIQRGSRTFSGSYEKITRPNTTNATAVPDLPKVIREKIAGGYCWSSHRLLKKKGGWVAPILRLLCPIDPPV